MASETGRCPWCGAALERSAGGPAARAGDTGAEGGLCRACAEARRLVLAGRQPRSTEPVLVPPPT